MSLVSICNQVLAVTGFPAIPSGIAANVSDTTAQQLLGLANDELRALSELFSWPQLSVEYSFSTVAAQSIYPMPLDCRILEHRSVFNADDYFALKQSMSTEDWYRRKISLLADLSVPRYRVVYPLGVPSVEITPAPTEANSLVAVYETTNLTDAIAVSGAVYSADANKSKIPERCVYLGLRWRFRRAKGMDYSAELAEYNNTIRMQFSQYTNQGEIPVGGRRVAQALNIPDTFGGI